MDKLRIRNVKKEEEEDVLFTKIQRQREEKKGGPLSDKEHNEVDYCYNFSWKI